MLNILGGIVDDFQGEISVDGHFLSEMSEKEWDNYRNEYLGIVFQDYCLLEQRTVRENLEIAIDIYDCENCSKMMENALKRVGMLSFASKKVSQLSGGQKQRVAIARAILKNPHFILADEPTGNLDSHNSKEVFELLKDLSKEILVIIASHDDQAINKYADQLYVIEDGYILKTSHHNNNISISQLENEKNITRRAVGLTGIKVFKYAVASIRNQLVKNCLMTIVLAALSVFIIFLINAIKYDCSDSLNKRARTIDDVFLYFSREARYEDSMGDSRTELITSGDRLCNALSDAFGKDGVCGIIKTDCFNKVDDDSLQVNILMLNVSQYDRIKLKMGKYPDNAHEILITDYLATQLGFEPEMTCVLGLGLEMRIVGVIETDYTRHGAFKSAFIGDERYEQYTTMIASSSLTDILRGISVLQLKNACLVDSDRESKLVGSKEFYASIKTVESIIAGRIPEDKDELVVSWEYADRLGIDLEDFKEEKGHFYNLGTDKYGDAFDHSLIMNDYFPDGYRIVGVAKNNLLGENTRPNVYVVDEIFCRLKEDVILRGLWDAYSVVNGSQISKVGFETIDRQEIRWNDTGAEIIYDFRDSLDILEEYIIAVTASIIIVYVLCCVLLISFNVKAQHSTIGIMRTLGYTKGDISKVFFVESAILSIVSTFISLLLCLYIRGLINSGQMHRHLGVQFELWNFNSCRTVICCVVLILICVISAILPIRKMVKHCPFRLIHEE